MTHCGGESERYAGDRPQEESTDKGNAPALPAERQNDTTTLENSLMMLYGAKHTFAIQPNNPTFRYLPKGNENICLFKDLHANVHSNFIQKSPNLKQSKCPSAGE